MTKATVQRIAVVHRDPDKSEWVARLKNHAALGIAASSTSNA